MNDESPFDPAWTWVVSGTLSLACAAAFIVRGGGPFPVGGGELQDDFVATVGYWGSLICLAGTSAAGFLLNMYFRKRATNSAYAWPRLQFLEGATRVKSIAFIGFYSVVFLFVGSLYVCLSAYLSLSRVSLWDETKPLENGFIRSRVAAMNHECAANPCFRFHELDGVAPFAHEWFWFSDAALLGFVVLTISTWSVFIIRTLFRV